MQSVQHDEYKWRQALQGTFWRLLGVVPRYLQPTMGHLEGLSHQGHHHSTGTDVGPFRLQTDQYVRKYCKKAFHVSSDDPPEILGLSICGAFCLVAAGAPDALEVETCALLWMARSAAPIAASTSPVVYVQPSIGHPISGILQLNNQVH